MHYIRLYRPPKVVRQTGVHVELLFTITTDLGDAFLYHDTPIDIYITAHIYESAKPKTLKLTKKGEIVWVPEMRVAKPKIVVPRDLRAALVAGTKIELCISAGQDISADGAHGILSMSEESEPQGQIMPLWTALSNSCENLDVSIRKICLDDDSKGKYTVELEEEIGESIARHIWDAGVLAMCSIAGAYLCPSLQCSQGKLLTAMKNLLSSKKSANILELGCGVGILGLGLATTFSELRKAGLEQCTIMMTDLDEAEARTRSNMQRLGDDPAATGLSVRYESLDWEEGRKGGFGPEVEQRSWDLIIISDCTYNVDMLPALVETLSAIHSSNVSKASERKFTTKVFLALKPRHSSESAFFDLMEAENWTTEQSQVLGLGMLDMPAESVEMYLFSKDQTS